MDDYIKREDAKDAVMNTEPLFALCKDGIAHVGYQRTTDVIAEIDKIPSADVAPVRHGHWVLTNKEKTDRPLPECSCCGWYVTKGGVLDFTYCPNCGAKMDEGGTDGTDDC